MSDRSLKVRVRLVGGYGNQLFALAAGFLIAERNQLALEVDSTVVGPGRTNHGVVLPLNGMSTIDRFGLVGSLFTNVERLVRKIRRELKWLRCLTILYPKTFESTVVGFNDELLELSGAARIFGYFQSHVYFDLIQNKTNFIDAITPRILSDWYRREIQELESENPIVLHVRRGDYLTENETFGLLSSKYYQNATRILDDRGANRSLWVYSDDIEAARSLLERQFPERCISFREAPESIDPLETLLVMSRAKFLITANSSFSWWAATLGLGNNVVVSPSPWFRSLPEPEKLKPAQWSNCASDWL